MGCYSTALPFRINTLTDPLPQASKPHALIHRLDSISAPSPTPYPYFTIQPEKTDALVIQLNLYQPSCLPLLHLVCSMLLQTRLSTRPEKNAAAVLLPLLLLVPPHDSRPYFSLARHDSDPLSLLLPVNAFHLQIMLPVSPVSPLLPASPYSRHFQPLSCIPFRLCTACPFSSCHVQSLRKQ